jgi:Lrp/AsnC family transcriptional regulator for asnA, asnC and gidA
MISRMGHDELDELDLGLIGYLQRDGRSSLITLGQKLGVAHGTVRNRLDRLLARGFISVVGVVDPVKVGFQTSVLIGISVDLRHMEEIERQLIKLKEVTTVTATTGRYDFAIWANFRDDLHLMGFIRTKFSKIKGIRATETFHILSMSKRVWQWVVPVELRDGRRDKNSSGANRRRRKSGGLT